MYIRSIVYMKILSFPYACAQVSNVNATELVDFIRENMITNIAGLSFYTAPPEFPHSLMKKSRTADNPQV